jgi:hypothetical protein
MTLVKRKVCDESAVQAKLKDAIERNKALGQELGMENLQRLHAERALLKRESELLKDSEDGRQIPLDWSLIVDMKQNMKDLTEQKQEADLIIKQYVEKHGSLEPETQTAT